MRRRWSLVFCVIAACYSPRPLSRLSSLSPRQDAPAVTTSQDWNLDENEAVAYALEHGPQLADRADAERVASEEIGAARQLSNPEVRIGQTSDERIAGATHELSIALRLRPDMPWELDAKVAQARAASEAERALTAGVRRDLTSQIRTLYASLAYAGAKRELVEQQLAIIRSRLQVVGERVDRGTGTRLEALLTEQDAADLEAARSEADVELVRARGELAQLLGIPPGQAWQPSWDTAVLRDVRDRVEVGALTARALDGRPELAELAARSREADALAHEEKAKRIPWFEWLQVERSTGDETRWGVGAAFRLPVLSLNRGRIAAAEAARSRAEREREREGARTMRAIAAAAEVVELTGARVRELSARLDPTSREIAALLAQEQASATADPVKLLLLQERQIRATKDLLAAGYDHRIAVIALDALAGGAP